MRSVVSVCYIPTLIFKSLDLQTSCSIRRYIFIILGQGRISRSWGQAQGHIMYYVILLH